MKNLIKLVFMVLVLTMATESYAQRIGIKAGLNLSKPLVEDDEVTLSDDFKMHPGYHVGLIAEFGSGNLVFQPGLLLSSKGYNLSLSEEGLTYEEKANLLYIDVPLTLKAYYVIQAVRIFGIVGPYMAMGLSGKRNTEVSGEGITISTEEDVNFGSDAENDDLKRLDYGLIVGAGLEIQALQISINYAMGLANISAYTDYGTTVNSRVLGISVAYYINKKK